MNHLDLFSGIGGFALGLQMAGGFNTVGFCERDKFCQQVLKKHWPDVPIYDDITKLTIDSIVSHWYDSLSEQNKEFVEMVAKRKDYDHAVELYNKGLSIEKVAEFYGMSRQSMWKILQRRGCFFRSGQKYGKENHFYRGTKASDKAQNLLEWAIKDGIVQRKTHCEMCGNAGVYRDGRTRIHAHHPDYNKPLEVMWLCQSCHHEWHKTNKAIERKEVHDELTETTIDIVTGGFP